MNQSEIWNAQSKKLRKQHDESAMDYLLNGPKKPEKFDKVPPVYQDTIFFMYSIVDNKTGKMVGVYMPHMHIDQFYFGSEEEARNSNCHGTYLDKVLYDIIKIKATYKMVSK